MGINVITSDIILERREFEEHDSLRSPTYLYNLLEKLGEKRCALCDCKIPQIIQGAHIWPVASIKRSHNLNQDEKLNHAINKDNGIWLCINHHKLFDLNIIAINDEGRIKYKNNLNQIHESYLRSITLNGEIDHQFINENFLEYLSRRNNNIQLNTFSFI